MAASESETGSEGSDRMNISQAIQQAIAHHQAGRLEQAEQIYRQVLARNPDQVDANHYMGAIAIQVGKPDQALPFLNNAIRNAPDFAEPYNKLGIALKAMGRSEDAVTCFRKAATLDPDSAQAFFLMGVTFQETGHPEQAVRSYERVLSLIPDHVNAHVNLGTLLQEAGDPEKAVDHFERATLIDPRSYPAQVNLGNALKEAGLPERAEACFRQVLALNPGDAQARKHLAYLKTHAPGDGDIAAMETLYNRQDIPDSDRMLLGFGLGKALSDTGAYDAAMDCFIEANRLKRASYAYDPAADRQVFDRIRNTYSPALLQAGRRTGLPDETPVFIVGMPRSGTSLVEQILASHPRVSGAGELIVLEEIVHDFFKTHPAISPLNIDSLSVELAAAGRSYLEAVRNLSPPGERITDKMPHNFMQIGFIRLILPRARIIHCTRDPMDTCFSIFKHLFEGKTPLKYAYDMTELGGFYRLYKALMDHWNRVLPGVVHEIRYEKLVSDQEGETRRLLEFCGLPWDDACLCFFRTDRRVATASASQVRQPMYTDSVGLWRRYEPHLSPLKAAIYD